MRKCIILCFLLFGCILYLDVGITYAYAQENHGFPITNIEADEAKAPTALPRNYMRDVVRLAREYKVSVPHMRLALIVAYEIGGITLDDAVKLPSHELQSMIDEAHEAFVREQKRRGMPDYTVTFIDDGNVIFEQILKEGDQIVTPHMNPKEHYLFLGWTEDLDSKELYVLDFMPAKDLELHAVWQEVLYDLVFFDEDGIILKHERLREGTQIQPPDVLERDHFIFLGWSEDQESSEIYQVGYMPNHDLYLYALWQRVPIINMKLSLGAEHSAVLMDDGSVFTWGSNGGGELGNNTANWNSNPNPVNITNYFNLMPSEHIIQLSLGVHFSMALSSKNRVFTWGRNWDGVLGNGTYEDQWTPHDITPNFHLNEEEYIVHIASGKDLASAISSDGRMFVWGMFGPYIYDMPYDMTHKFDLDDDDQIMQSIIGNYYYAVLTRNGQVFTFGANWGGFLGNGIDYSGFEETPINITHNFNLFEDEYINNIQICSYHSLAISNFGRVFTWGLNYGMLGFDDGYGQAFSYPVDITSQFALDYDELIIEASLGEVATSVITTKGRVFFWGQDIVYTGIPIEITHWFDLYDDEFIIQVKSGLYHYAYLTSHNRIFTFGQNWHGQLGDGTYEWGRNYPVDISFQFIN